MLPDNIIRATARGLYEARKSRTQVRMVSVQYPQMTIEDGYAIQREWVRMEVADGRTVRGRKIGLTSRAMQLAANITEPDYAPLMDDMFFEQGIELPTDRFIVPKVEVELAFVLNKTIRGPNVSLFDVLTATEYVVPAIEIIDSRMEVVDRESNATRKVVDTISDFAANAGIVLGGRPVRPMDVDLRRVGAVVHKNGNVEETGLAAGVLNHPGNGVAWLANRIAPYGEQLNEGDVVLAGSFIRPIAARSCDSFFADYGEMGSVSIRFA